MKRRWVLLLCFLNLGLSSLRAQNTNEHSIVQLDPSLNTVVAENAKLEIIYHSEDSFEGPTWIRSGDSGYLIFDDGAGPNVIDKWTPDGKVSVFLKSLAGERPANGTTLDRQGRVVFCASHEGQIVRLEKNGERTILADQFDGKHLIAPNDLVYRSDGSLYFTDFTSQNHYAEGGGKPHRGLYLLKASKVQYLSQVVDRPNGLAFSPDEKYLYVDNDGLSVQAIWRFDVQRDGTISNGMIFIDMSGDFKGEVGKLSGWPDGMKVDKRGNVYCTGPGGVWIVSPTGKHMGTILTPQPGATNVTFGGNDAKTLYVTGGKFVARIPVKVAGILAGPAYGGAQ